MGHIFDSQTKKSTFQITSSPLDSPKSSPQKAKKNTVKAGNVNPKLDHNISNIALTSPHRATPIQPKLNSKQLRAKQIKNIKGMGGDRCGSLQSQSQQVKAIIQRANLTNEKFNVVGENHEQSDKRRELEQSYCLKKTGSKFYAKEWELAKQGKAETIQDEEGQAKKSGYADEPIKRWQYLLSLLKANIEEYDNANNEERKQAGIKAIGKLHERLEGEYKYLLTLGYKEHQRTKDIILSLPGQFEIGVLQMPNIEAKNSTYAKWVKELINTWNEEESRNKTAQERFYERHQKWDEIATTRNREKQRGVWKVGSEHINHIKNIYSNPHKNLEYNLETVEEFNEEFKKGASHLPTKHKYLS